MTVTLSHLTNLVGSRICHDLISPVGAISNGVELLNMNSNAAGPEISLITQSVENANARIRFFRIAYGAAGEDQAIGALEIRAILRDISHGGRLVMNWQADQDVPRREAKLAFLLVQCLETAMAWGGVVTVSCVGGNWAIAGEADQLRMDAGLWAVLSDHSVNPDIQASTVQFPLAALCAAEQGRVLSVETSDTAIRVRF